MPALRPADTVCTELRGHVAAATGRIGWIFCAMNKYDLWREQKDEVEAYYGPTGICLGPVSRL